MTDPRPRLHAAWQGGVVGLWCDTGTGRPESVAPPASVTAVGRAGAPEHVVTFLDGFRADQRVMVRVPVNGRVRPATVPGIRVAVGDAARLCATVAGDEPWVGPTLRALGALSEGVGVLAAWGHVVPTLSGVDDSWSATWDLVPSVVVDAWVSESLSRCHGLVASRTELRRLLAALTDHHVRRAVAPLATGRRSGFGAALVGPGDPPSGGPALARALDEFGRAAAARDVEVVLRVLEPAGDDDDDEVDPSPDGGGDGPHHGPWWRLEVMVRTATDSLRPFTELADPGPVADAVHDVMDRAVRSWPPLDGARSAPGAPDLLLSTPLVTELVDEGIRALRGHGVEVLLPRAWTRVRAAVRATVAPQGAEAVDTGHRLGLDQLAEVDWQLLVDGEPMDEAEIEMLVGEASDLVRLRGRWVRADPGALRRAARFLAARRGERSTAPALVAALASDEAEGVEVEAPTTLDWVRSAPRPSGPPDLPDWFGATLRPYQEQGVAWLLALARSETGAVLADDMGLGKTVQVLALTAAEHRAGTTGPTLVVAPLTLLATWEREAARFAPGLGLHVHHGADRARGRCAAALMARADLVLTSYGTATRDAEELSGVAWRRVVADEAQTIKNPGTAVSRAVRSLPARHRVALTGTPVENRLDELRAVLDFANPGLVGSTSTFRARFAVPIESHRDEAAASRLRALAAPVVLRRLKTDPAVAADLPDKQHIRMDTPLTTEQAGLYRAVVEDMMEQVKDSQGASRKGAILSGLTALKQVCNHPAHYLGDGSSLLRGGVHRSGKLAVLDEVLAEILDAGEKVLLFTQYRAFGDLILPMLQRRAATEVPFLHGGVSAGDRARMVERFQEPDGPPLMLASLRAGGTGLTLTEANHVMHLDRWWNPAVESQATDRVHRIGQTRVVQVRTLVSPGTVEDRIDELLLDKEHLAEMTLGPLAGALTEMADDDLAALVGLTDHGGEET